MYRYTGLITLLTFLAMVYADGGFTASCSHLSLDPATATLTAKCKRADKSTVTTTLDLDECVVNSGGNLLCQRDGGFSGSCYPQSYLNSNVWSSGGSTLFAICDGWMSSLQLNDCIGNHDGVLAC